MILGRDPNTIYPFTFERSCPLCGRLISITTPSREDLAEVECHLCHGGFAVDPQWVESTFGVTLPAATT